MIALGAAARGWLSAFAIAALAGLLWWAAVKPRMELAALRTTHAAALASHAATLADLAAKTRLAAERAAAASAAAQRDRATADTRLKEKTDEAHRAAADLAAALRTGERRLQDWWACHLSRTPAGDAAGDGAEADAARRADSAGRIAAAVDHDAAVIDWLWDRWQADRRAVVAAGCAIIEE